MTATNSSADAVKEATRTTKPTPQVTLRKATTADAAGLSTLQRDTFKHTFGWSMPADHLQDFLDNALSAPNFAKAIENTDVNTFFVAVFSDPSAPDTHDQLAGFVHMRVGTTEDCIPADIICSELARLYLSREHTGLGLGRLLMEKGLEWAREYAQGEKSRLGVGEEQKTGVWLGVWEEHPYAQKFYQSFGFDKCGKHPFVMGDTTQYDDIRLKIF